MFFAIASVYRVWKITDFSRKIGKNTVPPFVMNGINSGTKVCIVIHRQKLQLIVEFS